MTVSTGLYGSFTTTTWYNMLMAARASNLAQQWANLNLTRVSERMLSVFEAFLIGFRSILSFKHRAFELIACLDTVFPLFAPLTTSWSLTSVRSTMQHSLVGSFFRFSFFYFAYLLFCTDGDMTVLINGLDICTKFQPQQSKPMTSFPVKGMVHGSSVHNKEVIAYFVKSLFSSE